VGNVGPATDSILEKKMLGPVRAAVFGLLISAPGMASAATLTATFSTDVSFFGFEGGVAGDTAFVIDFDDSLGSIDGVLEGDEFLSFAWVNNPFTIVATGEEFRTLLAVAPSIPGAVSGFVVPYITNPFSLQNNFWVFRQAPNTSTGSAIAATSFTYAVTLPPSVSPVPLPAAGILLVGALGGLAAVRRRRS
jgi:hypothetical protein